MRSLIGFLFAVALFGQAPPSSVVQTTAPGVITDNGSTVAVTGRNLGVGNSLLALSGFPATWQTAHVTLSAAQVASASLTGGPQIVPAVAGKTIVPMGGLCIWHVGTTPYTGAVSTGFVLASSPANVATSHTSILLYPIIPNVSDEEAFISGSYYAYPGSPGVGLPLSLYSDGYMGGDGGMDIWIFYLVIG